ncbi:hypothetical protein HNQ42_003064 [Rummeliibacillus stabekisii]|nr:hypothetical protein [Rummeliibacillus stabekisii]
MAKKTQAQLAKEIRDHGKQMGFPTYPKKQQKTKVKK